MLVRSEVAVYARVSGRELWVSLPGLPLRTMSRQRGLPTLQQSKSTMLLSLMISISGDVGALCTALAGLAPWGRAPTARLRSALPRQRWRLLLLFAVSCAVSDTGSSRCS